MSPGRTSPWTRARPGPPGAPARRCCATRPATSAAWPPACWPSTNGSPQDARLRTYADVEALWSEVVAPEFPTFACMQDGDGTVPPDSRWHANWRVPKA